MSSVIQCGAKSLPRSIDVPVSISKAQTETTTDLSVAVFVASSGPFTHGAGRIAYYSTVESVEAAHGGGSEAAAAARAFFSQSNRAATMAVGQAFAAAQKGYAKTGAVGTLAAFQAVTDGSFAISIDGVSEDITALNFSTDTTLALVAARIQSALQAVATGGFTAATCVLSGSQFVITSGVAGDGSGVSVLAPVSPASGTDISGATLMNGRAATTVIGYTPTGLAGELTLIAEAARCSGRFVYGWDLDQEYRDSADQVAAAAWAAARTAIMAITSNNPLAYDADTTTDVGYVVGLTGNTRAIIDWLPPEYSDQYPGMACLAQMLGVNYNGRNTHRTAKFMDLSGINTAPIDETQLSVLQGKGYNVFTKVGNSARTYRNGITSNSPRWYIDERIDLDNFGEEAQVATYNVFLRNPAVGLNVTGDTKFYDALIGVCEKYVFNGCFSERTVIDSTTKEGVRILPPYTIELTPLELLTDADRADRDRGVATITVNLTGAAHSLALNIIAVQ